MSKETIKKLYDERNLATKRIQELQDRIASDDFTADDKESLDKAFEDMTSLKQRIEAVEKSEKLLSEIMEERKETHTLKEDEEPQYEKVLKKVMLKRGNVSEAGLDEKEFEVFQKAQSTTDSEGGYTIPETWLREIVKNMAYFGPFAMESGMTGQVGRVLNTVGGGKIHIPKHTNATQSGRMLSEGSDASSGATDATFDEATLDAFPATSDLIRVSNYLLQDSGVDFAAYLGEHLGERLGRIFNSKLTNGVGGTEPRGITDAATLYDATAAAGAITQSEILGLKFSVDRAYRQGPQVGFMLNDDTLKQILLLDTSASNYTQPIWQPSFAAGTPETILGSRYWINNDFGKLSDSGEDLMAFGDFSKFYIRTAGGITIARSDQRYIEYNETAWVGFMRFDSELVDVNAVKRLKEDAT